MQDGKGERKRLPLCIRLFVRVSRPMQEIRNANRLPTDPRQFLHVHIILASRAPYFRYAFWEPLHLPSHCGFHFSMFPSKVPLQ